ncbi:MAG: glutaredoxin domain-containing protein [Nanoarchaeota archaeon]
MVKEHKVLIWRTVQCPWCHKTEEFLNAHKIKFKSIYVDKDVKAAQEMIRKSGQMGVPVTEIDGKIVVGYDPETFKKLLNLK